MGEPELRFLESADDLLHEAVAAVHGRGGIERVSKSIHVHPTLSGLVAVLQNGTRTKLIAKDGLNPFAQATAVHFRNFINATRGGQTPTGIARDNRNILGLVLAAYDSADFGKVVETRSYLA